MPGCRVRLVPGPVVWAALLLCVCAEVAAQPNEKCERERVIAENRYLEGFFDEAIALLAPCLERDDLPTEEAVQVYRLIGLAHMNKGDLEQARQTVSALLASVSTYEADPIQDPPSYVTMVTLVRQEIEAAAQPEEAPVEPVAEPEVQPPAAQPEVRVEPPPLRPEEQTPTSIVSRRPEQQRRILRTPKSWLLATGGAIVVATAVALAFGGGTDSSPGPPR